MFAVAFDLVVAETLEHHPKGVAQAYADIKSTLHDFDFEWVQGSLYISEREDLAILFAAIVALKALPWFPACVRTSAHSESSNGPILQRSSKADRWDAPARVARRRKHG